MAYHDQMSFANQYLSAPQMFNPNETEEEKRKRYQAESLRDSVSNAQVKSQQKEYERLAQTGKGPQGRRVGSRNTFVAASPFEHLAHVASSYIKGKDRKKVKGELEESLAKQATTRATEKADERIKQERLEIIKTKQAEVLEEHYGKLDENAKNRLALDHIKAEETKAKNKNDHIAKMAKIDAEANNFEKTTAGERKTIGGLRSGINVVTESGKTFKDSFAQPFAGMPFVSRAAVRFATTTGYDPTGMFDKPEEGESSNLYDAARWIANWKMSYTLPERNAIFGATLTPNEQIAWDEAGDISLNLGAGEIRRRMAQIEDAMRKRADSQAYTGTTAGQNPRLWSGMTTEDYGYNTYTTPPEVSAQAHQQATGAPQPKGKRRLISYKDYMPDEEYENGL